MSDKIKILVITDGESGCAYFRSMRPHQYIAEHYPDLFEVTIKTHQQIPNFEQAIKPFDIIHIHKQLDPNLNMVDVVKFYDKKLVVDIDDYWDLGTEHPMSAQSKAEKWHIPIINHLKAADMVSTTTEDFKKEIVKYNKNCYVFPNAVDVADPQFQPIDIQSRRIRFGMICGSSHMVDFELIRGMVNQLPKDVIDKIQFVLCGFDTRGTKSTIMANGEIKREPIKPQESVWYEYEKILTDNYKIVSPNHAQFLHMFIPQVEYPDNTEAYRRIWTKDINHYATHYNNIDVLLVPLKDNQFNRMKCIVGDSLISTNNGIFKIRELYDNQLFHESEVEGINHAILNHYKYENVPTIKITTKNGYEIEGTPHHRILINSEWKKLEEFTLQDKIELTQPVFQQSQYQKVIYPMLLTKHNEDKVDGSEDDMLPHITINEKWGRLLGYIMGDGCIKEHGFSISCDKRYPSEIEDITNIIKSIGLSYSFYEKKYYHKKNQNNEVYGVDIIVPSKTFSLIAKKYHFKYNENHILEIPNIILKSPKSVIREFLRGLFESDGTINSDNGGSFCTKSETLAKQVQYLLLGFGITSKLRKGFNSKYRKYYYYVNLRKEECVIFEQQINFVSIEKREKLREFCSRQNGNHTFKLEFTDEIVSISHQINTVYDIEVKDVHRYNANGIINHNSDLKVAEAGFFHKAIIANSVGPYNIALKPYIGKGGVINEDGNALLVDPSKNHKQWAKYITMLVHHPNMIKDLQERLYDTVKDMYSIETVCKARVDAYLELMGRKN